MNDSQPAPPSRNERSLRIFRVFLTLVILYLFLFHGIIDVWNYLGLDFGLFYEAAGQLWQGQSPYRRIFEAAREAGSGQITPWGHYIYPTAYAVHLIPFLVFPVIRAKKIHTAIVMLLYGAGWLLLRKQIPGKNNPWIMVTMVGLWFLWEPAVTTFRHGQANSVVLLLLFGAWWRLRLNHLKSAGLLIGFAIATKLTAALVLPLLLVGGHRKLTAWTVAGFLLPCLILFPGENWLYFTRVFPAMTGFMELDGLRNLQAFFIQFSQRENSVPFWPSLLSGAVYTGFLMYFLIRRHSFMPDQILLAGMLLTPIFSGEHSHHYMMAALPACWLMGASLDISWKQKRKWWLPALMALFLLPAWYYYLPGGHALMSLFTRILHTGPGSMLAPGHLAAAILALGTGLFRCNPYHDHSGAGKQPDFTENPPEKPSFRLDAWGQKS
jgi:hypothetical protein